MYLQFTTGTNCINEGVTQRMGNKIVVEKSDAYLFEKLYRTCN